MPRRTPKASPTRVTLLLLFLAAMVAVAALLAYEAHTASRAERRTVERALADYVATAAWEFQSALRKSLEAEALRAFGVVTAGSAQTPRDPLVPLAALRGSAESSFACGGSGDAGGGGTPDADRQYARLDLSTGRVVTDPLPAAGGEAQRLEAALQTVAASLPPVDRPFAVVWGQGDSRAVLVAVRHARLDVPVALYAFTTCASALRQRLPGIVARTHPLLPAAVAGSLPNDSLLSLTLRDGKGAVLMQVGRGGDGQERDESGADAERRAELHTEVPLPDLGGARLSVALQPAAMRHLLLIPAERGRVPLLIGLLALTAILAALSMVQVRREHELAQLRADFTSSVSHELRTPLAQILLFGETLSLDRARTPEERRFAADTIVREARRLMQLVDNILGFAQLRRGESRLQLAEMSLTAVVADVAAAFAPLAEARGSRLEVDLRDETFVRADREALRQVVLNLLDNATKYGARGQAVRVAVRSSPAGVSLVVEDEGSGLLPSDRERVWLPYVRLTAGGASPGGSGLGLAVVRELTRAMGASARVEEASGGGASFVVDFIAVRSAPAQGTAPAIAPSAARLPGR